MWFAAAENRGFSKRELQKDLVRPLTVKRKVALSLDDKRQGQYVRVARRVLTDTPPKPVYREGVPFPLLLVKPVFTNEDGSTGGLSVVTRDTPR